MTKKTDDTTKGKDKKKSKKNTDIAKEILEAIKASDSLGTPWEETTREVDMDTMRPDIHHKLNDLFLDYIMKIERNRDVSKSEKVNMFITLMATSMESVSRFIGGTHVRVGGTDAALDHVIQVFGAMIKHHVEDAKSSPRFANMGGGIISDYRLKSKSEADNEDYDSLKKALKERGVKMKTGDISSFLKPREAITSADVSARLEDLKKVIMKKLETSDIQARVAPGAPAPVLNRFTQYDNKKVSPEEALKLQMSRWGKKRIDEDTTIH